MDQGKLFGRGLAFPPRIGQDGRWQWSEGSPNIRQSIELILLTEQGERLMLSTFGAGISRYLFEPNTVATRRMLQEDIQNALRLWEPRIEVERVEVDADPNEAQRANITIAYRLVATQQSDEIGLSVLLGS